MTISAIARVLGPHRHTVQHSHERNLATFRQGGTRCAGPECVGRSVR